MDEQEPERQLDFKVCPRCNYALVEETSQCQFCGFQITHPTWKKIGAWILLILITYGLIKCHIQLMEGFGINPNPEKRSGDPTPID